MKIPANTTAIVKLPTTDIDSVLERGRLIKDNIEGIYTYKEKDKDIEVELASGEYSFQFAILR